MSKRGSSSASGRTQFTVRAMRPRAAPSVLLRLDGYVGAASASRTETARCWPTVAARLHVHLRPQRTRRPAFGASDGLEAGESPTRSVIGVASRRRCVTTPPQGEGQRSPEGDGVAKVTPG